MLSTYRPSAHFRRVARKLGKLSEKPETQTFASIMSSELTSLEWERIDDTLLAKPYSYGLPQRVYGSAVLASFNIRKLGQRKKRSLKTWKFLADVCRHFDLLAVQEIMDDLEGFNYLLELMGPDFDAIVSDRTGVFPGERGMGERLGFIYNTNIVRRGNIVSDISFDRSKLLKTVIDNHDLLREELLPYLNYLDAHKEWKQRQHGKEPQPPKVQIPIFLTFIRQPFIASFEIPGHPGSQPYKLMAINAHLYFGKSITDRRQEFDALMEWITQRVQETGDTAFPNFVLLGDLNLDFNDPIKDRARITRHMKSFDDVMKEKKSTVNINFPFLDTHPNQSEIFRTNARLSETFDHIGLFSHDLRLPQSKDNGVLGEQERGADYGMFNFVQLFSDALNDEPLHQLARDARKTFYRKFEHEVSDHMPIWIRLPLP